MFSKLYQLNVFYSQEILMLFCQTQSRVLLEIISRALDIVLCDLTSSLVILTIFIRVLHGQ